MFLLFYQNNIETEIKISDQLKKSQLASMHLFIMLFFTYIVLQYSIFSGIEISKDIPVK
jgi:hypothetical protein